jgi:hypothetical protein
MKEHRFIQVDYRPYSLLVDHSPFRPLLDINDAPRGTKSDRS